MLKAREFKNRIVIQEKTMPEPKDSFGSAEENWTDAFEVYAAFQPSGSREFPTQWKRFSETTARFIVRSTDDTRLINADKHRITMIFDHTASSPITQIWNISPPYPVEGKPFEIAIEGSEIQ